MLDTDAKGSHLVAERIRKSVKAAKPEGVDTKISIGLVVGAIEESSEHFLLKFIEKADYCLYQAKKAGGNRVVLRKLD
jgi:PleD family two-component response regulator